MIELRWFRAFLEGAGEGPFEEFPAVIAFGVEGGDDEIPDAAGTPEVGAEAVDAGGDEEPGDAAAESGVGHHGLEFSGEAAFGFMGIGADTAELGIGFVDEDEDLGEGHEDAAEAFEDDIGLAEPLTAEVFQDEDDDVEFGGDGFEDVGLAAADGAADGGSGQGFGAGGGESGDELVAEELFEAGEADAIGEVVGGFFEFDDVFAELDVDEHLDFGDDVVLGEGAFFVDGAFKELKEGVEAEAGGEAGELFGGAPERGLSVGGLGGEEGADELEAVGFVRGGDFDLEDMGESGDALVEDTAGLGDEDHGIAAAGEAGVAEPIMADGDALAVDVGKAMHGGFGEEEVGAFDEYAEVFGEEAVSVEDGAGAEAHLAEELQGQGGHLGAFAERIVVGGGEGVEVGGDLATGEHALDSEFVGVIAAAPLDPGVTHLFGVGVVEEADGAVEFVEDEAVIGEVPVGGEEIEEGDVIPGQ